MSAYRELLDTGRLGEAGVRLLYDVVRRIGKRYPPPDGGSWSSEKYTEAAHDFFVQRSGQTIDALFIQATDDQSFERLLSKAVQNFFRSEARKEERAKLLRRIEQVLEEDPNFLATGSSGQRPRRWSLAQFEANEEFTGNHRALLNAAWRAEGVYIARWRSATRTYISDRDSIAAFARAVLLEARGPVDATLLLDIAADRFGLQEPPLLVDIDDIPLHDMSIATSETSSLEAQSIWDQLTESERDAVFFVDATVREAAVGLGIGKTKAAETLRSLKAVLASLLDEDDGTVVLCLQEMAAARTLSADSASITRET